MTSIPVTFELDPPRDLQRTRGRREARRLAQDWTQPWTPPPRVTLLLRRRLDSGEIAGAEAAVPAVPGRLAGGHDRERVLRAVALAAKGWDSGPVAVAVSADEMLAGRAIGLAGWMLDEGAAPERLQLLLPESVLVGLDEGGLLALAALRDAGIGLVLDGFGAGVASLSVLRQVPLSGMKLARSVVRGLPEDGDDAAMARAGIAMAHAMGLAVVADGIETEAQRAFLAGCGCDEGQGVLFGVAG